MKTGLCLLLTTLFLIMGSSSIFAQMANRDAEVFPEQVSIDHNEAVRSFSRDFVTADANFNSGLESVLQSMQMLSQLVLVSETGNNNTIRLSQDGFNNFIFTGLNGDKNELEVEQRGDNNAASFRILGNYNELSLLQEGSYNIFSRSYNSDFNQGQFSQSGIGLNMQIEGQNSIPLIIEQRGQGSGILIENWD
ncbi:MAG: curlin repeat-containing protein [Gracilimonas sp.]